MKTNHPFLLSRRHFLQMVGGSAASLALLNGCVPATPATQAPAAAPASAGPQRGGVLRVAFPDSISSLQPLSGVTYSDGVFGFSVYENLTYVDFTDPAYPVKPLLAESWEGSADALTWRFTIRQGVQFHHGTPLAAQDVLAGIQLHMDPANASVVASQLGGVASVELADEQTVQFTLKMPNVDFPRTLAVPGLWIVPPDRTLDELTAAPSGTGPYKYQSYTPGERAVLVRNEGYWDSAIPYVDELQLVFIAESAAQVAALTSDTVNMLIQVGVADLPLLESDPNIKVIENPLGSYHVFVMRVDQKPFDDVRVRQALKHAVDRAALHQALMSGRGTIGNDQPIGPGTPFWVDVQPLAYDVAKAKALLTEAGYADGVEVALSTADIGGPRVGDAAIAIQEMVKAAGFTITIDKVPVGDFWSQKYMQAPFFTSWWPVFSDPNAVLPLAFSSQGFYNESGWGDPQVDELIAAGRAEQDMEKRKQIYAEAQQIISEQGGVLIPYFAPFLQAIRNTVQGHSPAPRIVYQNVWLAQG